MISTQGATIMKRLIKYLTPENNITAATDGDRTIYNISDIVDILQQIEELKNCNVAFMKHR